MAPIQTLRAKETPLGLGRLSLSGCRCGIARLDPAPSILDGVGEKLETARLLLPGWSDQDAALLALLSADPRVIRYIGDGQCWSPGKAADVSRSMVEHWQANGFGWRVAIEKESSEPVGFAALNYLGEGTVGLDPDEFEIGWWLFPSAWGSGSRARLLAPSVRRRSYAWERRASSPAFSRTTAHRHEWRSDLGCRTSSRRPAGSASGSPYYGCSLPNNMGRWRGAIASASR